MKKWILGRAPVVALRLEDRKWARLQIRVTGKQVVPKQQV
jgi:hypothetical protein